MVPRGEAARHALGFAGAITFATPPSVIAQDLLDPVEELTPDAVEALLNGTAPLIADPPEAAEELPGMGHKFVLLFDMQDSEDPENPTNDVIRVPALIPGAPDPGPPGIIAVVTRKLPPGIKIAALDHQINVRYLFTTPRTCAGGAPRVQLATDIDGDGDFDHNAFGYLGEAAFGAGCVSGEWDNDDMTDNVMRWDLSQFGPAIDDACDALPAPSACPLPGFNLMTATWDEAEAIISGVFPNHQILSGALLDDSGGFAPGASGEAFYDLFTMENRTLEQDQDTVRDNPRITTNK